jgi:hypothetical protein
MKFLPTELLFVLYHIISGTHTWKNKLEQEQSGIDNNVTSWSLLGT